MKKALSFIVIVAFICTMLPMQTMAQMRPSSSRLFRSLSRVGEVLGESASGTYKTTATVNVRSNPSVGSTSKVVGQQSAGVMATVVPNSATVVANGYSWINLDFVTGVDGWVAADNLILVAATPETPVTYTSADIDLFIKSIPQQIADLQQIVNNPEAFKKELSTGRGYIQTLCVVTYTTNGPVYTQYASAGGGAPIFMIHSNYCLPNNNNAINFQTFMFGL